MKCMAGYGARFAVKVRSALGDRSKGEYAMLLKMPAGFVAPIHAHTGDYHGVNLTGTWRHSFDGGEEKAMAPGSYVFQPGWECTATHALGPRIVSCSFINT